MRHGPTSSGWFQRLRWRINHMLTPHGGATMIWGFNSVGEFWFCAAPCAVLGLAGLFSGDIMLIVFGGCWFFGFYFLFVALDVLRTQSRKGRRGPSDDSKG